MHLHLRRIILHVREMADSLAFYKDVFGLKPIGEAVDPDWVELDAGAVRIALHRGTPGRLTAHSATLCFHADDVPATRDILVSRGAKMGKVVSVGQLQYCDGADPDGNRFQIASR